MHTGIKKETGGGVKVLFTDEIKVNLLQDDEKSIVWRAHKTTTTSVKHVCGSFMA